MKRFCEWLFLLLVFLPLAACGAGGGTDLSGSAGPPPTSYGSLAVKGTYTEQDLRHFLVRTHWAVTDDRWGRLQDVGLEAFVDEMLEIPALGSTAWEQEAELLLVDAEDPEGQEGRFPSRSDLAEWCLHLMVHNPNAFQEVLAFFWHDHFATSSEVLGGGTTWWMREHIDLFRARGAGNVKALVLDVSRDWAMLRWLDGLSSKKEAPNENYAREFLELFCLGVDNGYTQDDILEAARAFTGYRQVTLDEETGLRGVEFDPNRHDADDKMLFGVLIPGQDQTDDYRAVVDITFEQREAAEWFARSILSYFCYDDPPTSVVDQFARTLRDRDYELKPALRALFLSTAFYSRDARAGLVKSPLEFAVGFMKATDMPLVSRDTGRLHSRDLRVRLDGMGQVPTQPPTVNGWPRGELWLSAQGMVNRANFARDLIVDREDQAAAGHDPAHMIPAEATTSLEVVDAVAARLGVALSSSERDELSTYLDTHREGDGTDVEDPFDASSPAHVSERLRGLLYILAQHPTTLLR